MSIRWLKSGEPVPSWPARRYPCAHGYMRLRWHVGPRSHVETFEHRVVDGRVTDAEHVHHKNHIRDDNRPENLEHLTSREHSERHASLFVDECASLYEQGLSTPAIAREVGINHATVYRLLDKRGLIERRTSLTYAAPLPADELLREWHSQGVRAAEMCRRSGVGRLRIDRRLDELGLPRFRPGRPVPSHGDPASTPVTYHDGSVRLLTEREAA